MILQLLNKSHEKISLIELNNVQINETLTDKSISGSTYIKYLDYIENEGYLLSKTDEYVIKNVKPNEDEIEIEAVLNLEELQGKPIESFSSKEQTIDSCIKLAIGGTGWTILDSNIKKKRTIRKSGTNALEVIKDALKTYLVEVEFNTIDKTIHFVKKRGSDKGNYLMEKFNNTAIQLENNSDEFYTYIIAQGKTDSSGKAITCTVENHQFSSKMIGLFWKDERYTDIVSLKEDAALKLAELSKPRKSYSVTSSFFDKDICIGDVITLISKAKKIKEKQRVVKIIKNPDEYGKDTIEVANTMYTFEDIQKKEKETEETVNNITEDNGTLSLKAMQDGWVELNKVNVQELNAINASIGHLEANEVIADLLHAHNADIDDLKADKADIKDLTADNIIFDTAEGGSLDLKALLSQFISADNTQTLHLTSDNVVIDEAAIKDLIAKKIKVSDLMAGNIDASRFNIVSQDGKLVIKDNTIQISDTNRVRIQIGKQADGDYSMSAWDKDGNLMFNSNGITKDAIKSSIIRDDMVADDANISGKKINIESLITEVNNNTTLINASKINIDSNNQTLDIAFKQIMDSLVNINLIDYSDGWKIGELNFREDYIETNPKYLSNCIPIPLKASTDYTFTRYGNDFYAYVKLYKNAVVGFDYELITSDSITFNSSDYDFAKVMIYKKDGSNFSSANEINNYKLKLEEGNKNTGFDTKSITEILQTNFSIQQGKISDLIKDTTIEQNGQTVKLKDAYSSINQSIGEIDVKVAKQESNFSNYKTATDKRINSCELKITDDAFTVQVNKNKSRIFKVRYIRDWCGAVSGGTMGKWIEIKAFTNKGVNYAKGIKPTSNYDPYVSNIEKITDNLLDSSYPVKITITSTGTPYIQIDLGSVREDIDEIKVWHYWGASSDPQIFNDTKTEISEDGVHWYALFDSSVSGTYTETEYGHSVKVNNNSYNGSLITMNENGLDVRNGAITITDKAGDVVLKGTTDGNLLIRGALTNYDSNGNLKLAVRNQKVVLYNDNNQIIGGIGEVIYSDAIRGSCLNLDASGKFAGISVTGLTEANSYGVVFGYHRSNSYEGEEGLHAYRNLNMHGYNIKDFCVRGRSGYNGTFEVVDSISNNTVSYTKLKFVDGIFVGSN